MMTKIKAMFPRRMRVGQKMYSVEVVEAMIEKNCVGRTHYADCNIQIAAKHNSTGRFLAGAEIRNTFWHEVTHAILEDMGRHTLNRDERFVAEFANRLSKAIDSAKF
jgi:methyl coenzyme M reductase alpha subunit